jgi:hypothetical protein
MGVASAACRPIKWDEYIMLLLAARLVFSQQEKLMDMMHAVITCQRHFIGPINNIMCLATTTIQQNLHHPFCLYLKMCKSKNIRSKRDMPTHFFFASMDPLVCPVLNHAVYVEMFGTQGLGQITHRFAEYLENCLQVLISNQQWRGSLEPTASAEFLQPTQDSLAF